MKNTEICVNRPIEKAVGCVIMASGVGKRFGGNKLAADFDGEPLIYRVFDSTEGIFDKRVAVTRNPDTYALCKNKNIETIYHSLPYRSDTVRLGIEAVKDNVSSCMFIPADQPLITKETIQELYFAAVNHPEYIWQPEFEGVKGSPVVFPRWAFKELENLPQGKGGNVLVKKYPDRVRTIQALKAYELMDVDSQEDLKNLLKIKQLFP
jgi:molybdenum cofactor cytidylyltransferase